jgi:diguanylate cyclase (GGDEF)-like protein
MNAELQRSMGRITEPALLFPTLALLLLAVLWGTTLNLIGSEFTSAHRAAIASTQELTETYEAQMVRALREIDLTLKVVTAAAERLDPATVLPDLEARGLLPPNLLFTVAIVDADGNVAASTRDTVAQNVAGEDYFIAQREADAGLAVGLPIANPGSAESQLPFSRRMQAADGSFAGVAMLTVDAAYFVSGYEASKLGEHGVLGVLGLDGVFRARRSGELVTSGDRTDQATLLRAASTDAEGTEAQVFASPVDGVRRYTLARQLFDFPLAVVVGLSEAERMAPAERARRMQLLLAGLGSLIIIVVMSLLGRISWQLAQSRRRNVEEQVAHAERVEYLAYHDALTGLPNRSLFSKVLAQCIAEAQRYDRRLAVLFLDLDRFKHINDTLGHEAGDQLLQTVAERLRSALRESDTVARLGGDEFVVLLPSMDDEKFIAAVAQKILSAVARPFMLAGQEFRVTASVGISTFPRDGLDEQTLKKNADIAMYQAKAEGKNNFQFYSERLNTESLERLTLESSLRNALERDEFELHYQAKRDIRSNQITGMEALLRWQHPDLGVVAPMQFIPVADETGLIIAIGKWVLTTACRQNVEWQRKGMPKLVIAVNLTPRQFNDERLVDDVARILRDTGMEPRLLELEISEGMLMQNVERTLQTLTALKAVGVRIAIDDFGLGYSSLSELQNFPLDTVKIDRSFIRDVTGQAEDRALAEAIIAVGHSLSLTVVAQGVETREQADFLREHACDELQGFYFNRPVPATGFAEQVESQRLANVLALPPLRNRA